MASTLHDFVLNLLSDPQSLTAFTADPEGALNSAGLGEISAADVHDAFPLVLDYAPAHAVAGLESAMGALPVDSDALQDGQAGAIQQLQVFTQAISQATSISGQAGNAALGLQGAGSFAGDPQHGYTAGVELSSPMGSVAFSTTTPGLNDVPSHLTSAADLTNVLDASAGAVGNATTGGFTSSSALGSAAGAAWVTPATVGDPAAALNPAMLSDALSGSTGDVNAVLPGVAQSAALPAVPHLPVPANLPQLPGAGPMGSAAAQAEHTVSGLTSGTHLGTGQATDALHGVTDTATSTLGTVTGALHSGAEGAGLSGVTDTVTSTAHSAMSDATGAASHSPVAADLPGASAVSDTAGHVTDDLSGVTDHLTPTDLHLPF